MGSQEMLKHGHVIESTQSDYIHFDGQTEPLSINTLFSS